MTSRPLCGLGTERAGKTRLALVLTILAAPSERLAQNDGMGAGWDGVGGDSPEAGLAVHVLQFAECVGISGGGAGGHGEAE